MTKPHVPKPKPVRSPKMRRPRMDPGMMEQPRPSRQSARYNANRATGRTTDRIMDVVEVGAVGIVGAGLLGTLGSSFQK